MTRVSWPCLHRYEKKNRISDESRRKMMSQQNIFPKNLLIRIIRNVWYWCNRTYFYGNRFCWFGYSKLLFYLHWIIKIKLNILNKRLYSAFGISFTVHYILALFYSFYALVLFKNSLKFCLRFLLSSTFKNMPCR